MKQESNTPSSGKQAGLMAEFAQLSSLFMQLSNQLANLPDSQAAREVLDQLFKRFMVHQQQYGKLRENAGKSDPSLQAKVKLLEAEKERLELLYTSGIQFSSEMEMQSLMSKAIDTVIKALKADSGFIILVDEQLKIKTLVARNMDDQQQHTARDLSTTIIKEALKQHEPVRLSDLPKAGEHPSNGSIVRLGISSAICVPLMSGTAPVGAVYLDRRADDHLFMPDDLFFLSAFGKQLVSGIEISGKFEALNGRLIADAQPSEADIRGQFDCPEIVGQSRNLLSVLALAGKISPTDTSVIILGENGTGKELLARGIHRNSLRKDHPFIAINCSAIPENLLESELFGYESGAFTGAQKAKPGKIELADKGTLFLDEIGELDIQLQAKLLRFLQTGELDRLGSVNPRHVDVRIIAATNRHLSKMVREKQFREDLYYRLKVIEMTLPPLRERIEDILPLCNYLLEKHKPGGDISLNQEALTILERYDWPGNIRELENVLQRGIVLSANEVITSGDLPPELRPQSEDIAIDFSQTLGEAEQQFRKRFVQKIMAETSSRTELAQKLGVNRTYLYKLLEQLGLND